MCTLLLDGRERKKPTKFLIRTEQRARGPNGEQRQQVTAWDWDRAGRDSGLANHFWLCDYSQSTFASKPFSYRIYKTRFIYH